MFGSLFFSFVMIGLAILTMKVHLVAAAGYVLAQWCHLKFTSGEPPGVSRPGDDPLLGWVNVDCIMKRPDGCPNNIPSYWLVFAACFLVMDLYSLGFLGVKHLVNLALRRYVTPFVTLAYAKSLNYYRVRKEGKNRGSVEMKNASCD